MEKVLIVLGEREHPRLTSQPHGFFGGVHHYKLMLNGGSLLEPTQAFINSSQVSKVVNDAKHVIQNYKEMCTK